MSILEKRVVVAGCRNYYNYFQAREYIDMCLKNIAPSQQCQINFALVREANISHLRSRYFTAKLFHLPARANFTEKSNPKAALKKKYFVNL